MQKRIYNPAFLSVVTATLLIYSSSYADGDGASSPEIARAIPDVPVIEIGCVVGAGYCPQHPGGFSLGPQQVIDAIQHEVVCSEGESGKAHQSDALSTRSSAAYDSSQAAAALSHAVLGNPTLQLHEIKIAIRKLSDLDSDISLRAFAEIYKQSEKLAKRVIDGAKLPELSKADKAAMVERQAADLRRAVMLALRSIDQEESDRLLAHALDDSALSVAVAAGREIQRRTRHSGTSPVDQRCAYARNVRSQKLCNLINSGDKHARR